LSTVNQCSQWQTYSTSMIRYIINTFNTVCDKALKRVKVSIAFHGTPSHSYGVSLAIWDHTVLPVTWHKWTHPTLSPPDRPVLDWPTPEGWKAELTRETSYILRWFTCPDRWTDSGCHPSRNWAQFSKFLQVTDCQACRPSNSVNALKANDKNKHTNTQTDRQRQRDRQTDRQTETEGQTCLWVKRFRSLTTTAKFILHRRYNDDDDDKHYMRYFIEIPALMTEIIQLMQRWKWTTQLIM